VIDEVRHSRAATAQMVVAKKSKEKKPKKERKDDDDDDWDGAADPCSCLSARAYARAPRPADSHLRAVPAQTTSPTRRRRRRSRASLQRGSAKRAARPSRGWPAV
tara:strand:- start:722 stop:1036 length:315 start_codon:yes stop_codon:yes gene_type:complete